MNNAPGKFTYQAFGFKKEEAIGGRNIRRVVLVNLGNGAYRHKEKQEQTQDQVNKGDVSGHNQTVANQGPSEIKSGWRRPDIPIFNTIHSNFLIKLFSLRELSEPSELLLSLF